MSILSSYNERVEYKLEIIPPDYAIQCREATIVEKDGVELRSYHRKVYEPGDDISKRLRKCARLRRFYGTATLTLNSALTLPLKVLSDDYFNPQATDHLP